MSGMFQEMYRSVSRKEWRWFWCVTTAAVLVSSIPMVYGFVLAAVRGQIWTGRLLLAPGDMSVYLSYIEQVKQGSIFLQNWFTTESLQPTFNIFWFFVGLVARAFSLPALVAFHLSRIVLIVPLCAVSYGLTTQFFSRLRDRLCAFILFAFGSGVGVLFAPLFGPPNPQSVYYFWPFDLWVAESNTFLTMLYSPHFIASLTLFLLIAVLLLIAWRTEKYRYGVAAGLCGLVLFNFHPFHAPTLYAIGLVFVAMEMWRLRMWKWSLVIPYVVFVGLSVPSVLYHFLLSRSSSAMRLFADQNITLTPAIWYVMMGLGVLSIAWIGTLLLLRKGYELSHRRFLYTWIVVQTVLLYVPLAFQRRLVEGLQFPLVILAVPALVWLFDYLVVRVKIPVIAVCLGLAALLLPSTIYALRGNIQLFEENYQGMYFLTSDEVRAWEWLRENSPSGAVVLALPQTANTIPAWALRPVYVGHWAMTLLRADKEQNVAQYYVRSDVGWRSVFLKANNISYVVYGPRERMFGGQFTKDPQLVSVFRNETFEIFLVKK